MTSCSAAGPRARHLISGSAEEVKLKVAVVQTVKDFCEPWRYTVSAGGMSLAA